MITKVKSFVTTSQAKKIWISDEKQNPYRDMFTNWIDPTIKLPFLKRYCQEKRGNPHGGKILQFKKNCYLEYLKTLYTQLFVNNEPNKNIQNV